MADAGFCTGFCTTLRSGMSEILAVMLAAASLNIGKIARTASSNHFLLGFHVRGRNGVTGDRGALAHAEFAAAAA